MTGLEQRLKAGPAALEARLRLAPRPLSLSEPWHGLAEGAGQRAGSAFEAGEDAAGLAWVRCAVAIYDCLGDDVREPHMFDLSGMVLRVRAIRELGPVAGDAVLDPAVVFAWVRGALVRPMTEAVAASAQFKLEGKLPSVEDARTLRAMKNRLGVLRWLGPEVELGPELRAWLDVREQLL